MSDMNKRLSVLIGVVMVVAMFGSTLIPLFSTTPQVIQPTAMPEPTLPPPITDLSTITFETRYLHPSGLFSVGVPSGWQTTTTVKNANEAVVNMINSSVFSVVVASVIRPTEPVATVEEVSAFFNAEWLGPSWREYASWEETARRTEGDQLLIDFNVRQGGRNYIVRQRSWTDGDWIYFVRVLTLENGAEMLKYLVDTLPSTLQPNKQLADQPFDWTGYFDTVDRHLIRYPQTWTLEDAAPGRPASISGDGVVLRVETVVGPIADEAAARAWVQVSRPNATILSVAPIEEGAGGWRVAYQFTNVDGDLQSGLSVLLNSADDKVHVANVRVPGDYDLSSDLANTPYAVVQDVLASFTLLPDLNITLTDV